MDGWAVSAAQAESNGRTTERARLPHFYIRGAVGRCRSVRRRRRKLSRTAAILPGDVQEEGDRNDGISKPRSGAAVAS